VAHIDDLPLLRDAQVTLSILSSCVACQPSLFHIDNTFFSPFMSLLACFDKKIMQVCGDVMGLGLWESF
jgi:hypothetical protein